MEELPRVVIVGRPNVGKSTLFNRITGRRRAIVDPVAGSTRDRHLATTTWQGKRFELVDTGGLLARPETSLDERVAAQVRVAIDEADLICWVVDAAAGIVAEDEALASRLRSISERVFLVVNKIDHPSHVGLAMEFHRLGFEHLFVVSAEHGLGVGELLDEMAGRLPEPRDTDAGREETRIAIVGRPNVGKSSLLNRLAGEERVVVTEKAGTTRDAVDTLVEREGRCYRIVDTAGIRRKGKTESRADQLGVLYAQRAIERAHLCLLILDATEGVTTEDASIGGKIAEAGRGAVLVFNKWDLASSREQQARKRSDEARHRLRHLDFSPLAFVSALTGKGVGGLLPLVDRVREAQLLRIPTAELNRFLQEVAARHPPRARDGKEVKLLYATQTGVAPPRFVVFASHVRGLDRTYRRFLARRLRERYGFEGTPVRVSLRRREKGKRGKDHA